MTAARRRTHRPLLWASERTVRQMGFEMVAGIDEVGLGPLAGPAVAAAFVLPLGVRLPGLDDSKRMKPADRARVDRAIRRHAVAIGLGIVGPEVIDEQGLIRARQLSMRRAVESLPLPPEYLLVDAWDVPDLAVPQLCVVKGDAVCASIMAASIVAKVHRDNLMVEYDRQYPGYGFAVHKGYATRAHQDALRALGPSPIHRMSWAPIRAVLAASGN